MSSKCYKNQKYLDQVDICYDKTQSAICSNPDISGYCLLAKGNLCKKNFTYSNNTCIQNTKCNVGIKTLDTSSNSYYCKTTVCQNGKLSSDEQYCESDPTCDKIDKISADKLSCTHVIKCPTGTVLSDDKTYCKLKMQCPKGYISSEDGTFCKKNLDCPLGYKMSNDGICVTQLKCNKPYTLDLSKNICVQKICDNLSFDKSYCKYDVVCQSSNLQNFSIDKNVCIECPDNYSNINNNCVTNACPLGTLYDGKCYINNTIKKN